LICEAISIKAYSFAFKPIQTKTGAVILRPMLSVVLEYNGKEFPTEMLLDSGADYSIIRYDVAETGLNIPIDTLEECKMPLKGITDDPQKNVECEVTLHFDWKHIKVSKKIPVRIMKDPKKQPSLNLLGRDPFFYDFRVDFRMGYTKDMSLGKFIIYPEEKKRDPKKFKRPKTLKID